MSCVVSPTPPHLVNSSSFKHHLLQKSFSDFISDLPSGCTLEAFYRDLLYRWHLPCCNNLATCLHPPCLQSCSKSFLTTYYVPGTMVGA